MSIDYSKLRSLTARQFISALQSDGFALPGRRAAIATTRTLTGGA